MNSSYLPFEEIVLSRSEIKLLRRSAKKYIALDSCLRLNSLHLVEEEQLHVAGLAPVGTGRIKISDRGINYLAYITRRSAESRSTRAIAIIALVISILSLIAQVAISLLT